MKTHTSNGFTIIELLVTVTMIAIVLVMGVPSFKSTIRNNILTTEINDFVAILNYAKSEAVVRSKYVAVRLEYTSFGDSGKWEKGWTVFTDENKNGTMDTADGDKILRVHEALRNNHTLRRWKKPIYDISTFWF